MKVSDAMTKQLVFCLKSDSAQSVAALMKRHDIGSVPVVADLV
jgi:CBS domain-containing protein